MSACRSYPQMIGLRIPENCNDRQHLALSDGPFRIPGNAGREIPNVFIDTSAYKVRRYPSDLVGYMRGNNRILFGSNHPFWPAGECIAGLDELQLGADARSAFLTNNALRLFNLA